MCNFDIIQQPTHRVCPHWDFGDFPSEEQSSGSSSYARSSRQTVLRKTLRGGRRSGRTPLRSEEHEAAPPGPESVAGLPPRSLKETAAYCEQQRTAASWFRLAPFLPDTESRSTLDRPFTVLPALVFPYSEMTPCGWNCYCLEVRSDCVEPLASGLEARENGL